jgi:hypothetical protein
MSSTVGYSFYAKAAGGERYISKEIKVNGKANVADKKTLLTPKGAITQITKAEYEELLKNDTFNMHVAGGYITVMEDNNQYKAQEAADKVKNKDKSAQLTPEDYKGKKVKPSTKKIED